MTSIHIYHNKNLIIDIECFDTDFTKRMIDLFEPNKEYKLSRLDHRLVRTDDNYQNLWDQCLYHYRQFLNLCNLDEVIIFNPTFNKTDNTPLNQMHRLFTDGRKGKYFGQDIVTDNDQVRYHLDLINDRVHDLEGYISNSRKTNLQCSWLEIFSDEPSSPLDLDTVDYTIDEYPDVFAIPQILGKDYFTAFFNKDDIEDDICNVEKMLFFGLSIDYKNHRKDLRKSSEFNEWLSSNNCNDPVGGIPLGKLVFVDAEAIDSIPNTFKIDVVFS